MTKQLLIAALAGNPNAGKTTIFNNLTGSRQHVGNYSGVTVEKKEGCRCYREQQFRIVDLPGTYSLTAYSPEEVVARNFIIQEKPDVVIDVLDASNLERNLYLAMQIMELERPVVLVLNMADVAESRNIKIHEQKIRQLLGVEVVRAVGSRNQGMDEILQAAAQVAQDGVKKSFKVDYGTEIETAIEVLTEKLPQADRVLAFPLRWLALKLLENDKEVVADMAQVAGGEEVLRSASRLRQQLENQLGEEPELAIADRRYRFIGKVYKEIVTAPDEDVLTFSDKVDRVLTNRVLGIPIFLGLMWLVFSLVFRIGHYPQEWIASGVEWVAALVGGYLPDGELKSLVVDGAIGGVGSVLSFLPQILLLFFAIALLEGTGYMARAAFIMDRVMQKVGLHGKSFIPLMLGFGCGIPAIMGTRTLENPRDRMVTILVSPLMSCSARLPIYTLLIAAFFSENMAGNVLFSIYLLGIFLAVLMARIFRSVLFKGDTEPFVMELPPYRIPTLRSVMIHMWNQSSMYVRKAGTIILAVSVIVWFLTNYPNQVEFDKDYDALAAQATAAFTAQVQEEVTGPLQLAQLADSEELQSLIVELTEIEEGFKKQEEEAEDDAAQIISLADEKAVKLAAVQQGHSELFPAVSRYLELKEALTETTEKLEKEQGSEKLAKSYAGKLGQFFAPVTAPLGFDWKINVSLIAGFSAKEVVVSSLGTIYSVGDGKENGTSLKKALADDPTFNPLVAYTMMVFTLIYSPCLAVIATIKRETNSWKWAAFSMGYSTALAWLVAFLVYNGGKLLGLGS
ncbi:ferrous iron transport protein B [Azotosporobacter soli]|uniref:ferrous iron transport protein B n=1 Tax=Azotosporobacter soli TaxID=3055040 RepID=UPI0031FEC360